MEVDINKLLVTIQSFLLGMVFKGLRVSNYETSSMLVAIICLIAIIRILFNK